MKENPLKSNEISPSARPNIIMFAVLLYWLFVPDHVLIPHVISPIENALGLYPITGLAWRSITWFLNLGIPIVVYLVYLLIAKKPIKSAFSISKLSAKNVFYVAIFTLAIRAVDLLATRFIPFALGSWTLQTSGTIGEALILGALFAAVYEEFNFRGFLYSEYRNQRVSILKISLATGLFFGLIHSGIAVFTTAIFGIMWTYMLYYTRSIWAPLLSHLIYNGLGILLNPIYHANNQAEYESLMSTLLIATAIAAVLLIPAAVVCVKRFMRENRHNAIKKSELPIESKAFTITYWLLIAVMIAVIFIFRL